MSESIEWAEVICTRDTGHPTEQVAKASANPLQMSVYKKAAIKLPSLTHALLSNSNISHRNSSGCIADRPKGSSSLEGKSF